MTKNSRYLSAIHNENGFSLIEVMIAIVIFSIGILAVAQLQIYALNSNTGARKLTESSALGMGYIERIISSPYDTIVSGGPEKQGPYTIQWTVTENEPIDNIKTIHVTVQRQHRGRNQSNTLAYFKMGP